VSIPTGTVDYPNSLPSKIVFESGWQSPVMDKVIHFSCLALKALNFDSIRVDKATQVMRDALSKWAAGVHTCVAAVGENNFITGEVTGGNTFGSLYL
jgi:alpha-1,3-glucan synthase